METNTLSMGWRERERGEGRRWRSEGREGGWRREGVESVYHIIQLVELYLPIIFLHDPSQCGRIQASNALQAQEVNTKTTPTRLLPLKERRVVSQEDDCATESDSMLVITLGLTLGLLHHLYAWGSGQDHVIKHDKSHDLTCDL